MSGFCLRSHFIAIYVYVSAQGRGSLGGRVMFFEEGISFHECVLHTVIRHCLAAAVCL